jgi:hypothetical protein
MGRYAYRWLFGLAMLVAFAGVGFYSYNLGLAHGVAESTRIVASPGGTVPVVAYYWPRPWGFGFGFFPFFPLLFILFWIFVLRGIFWRGAAWRRGYGYGYGYGCGPGSVPPAFDEWHRRAHAQQDAPPTQL